MRLAIIVALACCSRNAHAAPAADELAAEAEALAAAGNFIGAAAKFRAAHAIDPRPDLLCNVGVAYYKAEDLPRAHFHLGRCLTRGSSLDAEFLATVTAVFRALEASLRSSGFVPVDIVVVPASATIAVSAFGGDDPFVGSNLVWLARGRHTVTVRADGYVGQVEVVEVKSADELRVQVVLQKRRGGPPSRRPAWIATGVTGALALGAVATYLVARSHAADASGHAEDPTDAAYQELADKALAWQKVSWGVTAAAVVGAGVGGYLWYRATRSPARVEVAPTAGGATIGVVGRF